MLENPYSLHPAIGKNFIGRTDILNAWRKRLTPGSKTWKSSKSWMVVGAGGMGKTSLLHELIRIANEEFKAHTISIDLGQLREIGDTEDLFSILSLEMPKAKKTGTKLRKWFGLQPDAPLTDLVGQITGELLNQVTGFAIGLAGGGFKIGNYRKKPSELEGTAHRLAQFLVNLTLLSEEQDSPVIVFLDQVGKCHDHPTWAYIAGMFLVLCKKIRFSGVSQIFFVVSLRPEREGLLRNLIDRRLFEEDIFDYTDLYPLSPDEGTVAITVRGEPYINNNLSRRIVTEIGNQGPLDPYTIQLASMAVWNYLLGSEKRHSATDLESDSHKLKMIIRQGHAEIIHPFMQNPVQWDILVILTKSHGGLTISQLRNRLGAEHNLSSPEIFSAIGHLLNPPRTGYRLLTEIRGENSSTRYSIAHDLLQEYILSKISDDQDLINQSRLILEYALYRFRENGEVLTDWELKLLWDVQPNLSINSELLGLIITSEMHWGNKRSFQWWENSGEIKTQLYEDILQSNEDSTSNLRLLLFVYYIDPILEIAKKLIEQLSFNAHIDGYLSVRRELINMLGQFGDQALPSLTEIARNDKNNEIRRIATKVLGQIGEKTLPTLANIIRSDKDEYVRSDAIKALGQLGETALSELTEISQSHNDYMTRRDAVKALSQIGDQALPALKNIAQNDIERSVRSDAVKALGQFGDQALPTLIKIAQSDKDEHVRSDAVKALGQFGDQALPTLIKIAQSDKDEHVRSDAVKALGQFGDQALPTLIKIAQSDKDEHVRSDAVKALGQFGDQALPTLIKIAQSDKEESVRLSSVSTLMHLGDTKTALPVLADLARNLDKTAFKTREDIIGHNAIDLLVQIGEPALPLFVDLYRKELVMRRSAIIPLGKIGENARPILTEMSGISKNKFIRFGAAIALRQLGDIGTAFPVLVDLVSSSDSNDSNFVSDVLEELAQFGDRALPTVTKIARNYRNLHIRGNAIKVLGQLGETALSELTEISQSHNDYMTRRDAVKALSQIGDQALPALKNIAQNDIERSVRSDAVKALGQFGDQALPTLIKIAQSDKDEHVRSDAVKALGQFGDQALPTLIKIAQSDKDEHVRSDAVKALGQFGDQALPTLIKIAQSDKEESVRLSSVSTLMHLGDTKTALPVLADLARTDVNSSIRHMAVEAMGQFSSIEEANQELLLISGTDPLSELGSHSAQIVIKNRLPEFFSKVI